MDGLLIGLIIATSSAGYVLVRRPNVRLTVALGKTLELLGVSFIVFFINVVIAVACILAIRSLTGRFLSVYAVNDVSLLGLSVLQGLVLGCARK